jgi:hypothetical protein
MPPVQLVCPPLRKHSSYGPGRTTTALKSHLKSLHAAKFAEFEKIDESVKVSLKAKKQEAS